MKKLSLMLLCGAALAAIAAPSIGSAAWNASPWRQYSQWDFAIDDRPIGGQYRSISIWTQWTSTSNRSESNTNNTYHAVANWCYDPTTGVGHEDSSNYVGPNIGSAVVHTCSGPSYPTWSGGWIWT